MFAFVLYRAINMSLINPVTAHIHMYNAQSIFYIISNYKAVSAYSRDNSCIHYSLIYNLIGYWSLLLVSLLCSKSLLLLQKNACTGRVLCYVPMHHKIEKGAFSWLWKLPFWALFRCVKPSFDYLEFIQWFVWLHMFWKVILYNLHMSPKMQFVDYLKVMNIFIDLCNL